MNIKTCCYLGLLLISASCYQPERNCKEFQEGTFKFTSIVDGKESTTIFERQGGIEIDHYQGKSDTSSVRWVNDCEYIVRKLYPKDLSEDKSIEMKILKTTDSSYTFEYGIIGKNKKLQGTAIRIK
jgi:hypothetical protein